MAGPQSIKRLADRYRDVVGKLSAKADQLATRLDQVEAKGGDAMASHERAIDAMEKFVGEVEDVTNQLTNGPPVEDGYTGPDHNGVSLHTAEPARGQSADADPRTGVVLNK